MPTRLFHDDSFASLSVYQKQKAWTLPPGQSLVPKLSTSGPIRIGYKKLQVYASLPLLQGIKQKNMDIRLHARSRRPTVVGTWIPV